MKWERSTMAEMMGTSRDNYAHMERATQFPTVPQLVKLSTATKMPLEYWLKNDDAGVKEPMPIYSAKQTEPERNIGLTAAAYSMANNKILVQALALLQSNFSYKDNVLDKLIALNEDQLETAYKKLDRDVLVVSR